MSEVVKAASASADAYELGHRLVGNEEPQQMNSCLSLAAVDLNQLGPLEAAMARLAKDFSKLDPDSARDVRRVSENTRRNSISPDSWDLANQLSDHILGSQNFDPDTLGMWLDTVKPGDAVALVAFCQDLVAQDAIMRAQPHLRGSLEAVIAAHDQAVFSARAHDEVWPGGLTVSLPFSAVQATALGTETLDFEKKTGWSMAVHTVVPAGEAAQRLPTWLERELEKKGMTTPPHADS